MSQLPAAIGPFAPIACLGRGEAGEVFLAETHGQPGSRRVALRLTVAPVAPEVASLFIAEADAARSLKHPNIIETYESGRIGDRLFVSAELAVGDSLRALIDRHAERHDSWADGVIASIAVQCARALHHAHSQTPSVLHRDLNPSSVFMDTTGYVKVAEFGVARAAAQLLRTQNTGFAITPRYGFRSPEVLKGAATIDGKADVFSLGVILWQLATGEALHQENQLPALLQKRAAAFPPDLATRAPHRSPQLLEAITRCLQLEPEKRPTARELVGMLEPIAALPASRNSDIASQVTSASHVPRNADLAAQVSAASHVPRNADLAAQVSAARHVSRNADLAAQVSAASHVPRDADLAAQVVATSHVPRNADLAAQVSATTPAPRSSASALAHGAFEHFEAAVPETRREEVATAIASAEVPVPLVAKRNELQLLSLEEVRAMERPTAGNSLPLAVGISVPTPSASRSRTFETQSTTSLFVGLGLIAIAAGAMFFALSHYLPKRTERAATITAPDGKKLKRPVGETVQTVEFLATGKAEEIKLVNKSKLGGQSTTLNLKNIGLESVKKPDDLEMIYDRAHPNMLTLLDKATGAKALVTPSQMGFPEGIDAEYIAAEAHNRKLLGSLSEIAKSFTGQPSQDQAPTSAPDTTVAPNGEADTRNASNE